MLTKTQQARRLADLRRKAHAVGTRHGRATRRARVTIGQSAQAAGTASWSYVVAFGRNA
jgi:hypothetical protein